MCCTVRKPRYAVERQKIAGVPLYQRDCSYDSGSWRPSPGTNVKKSYSWPVSIMDYSLCSADSSSNQSYSLALAISHVSTKPECTHLLFHLQVVNNRSEFTKNFKGLLVILGLGSDELGQIPKRFGGIQDLSVPNQVSFRLS